MRRVITAIVVLSSCAYLGCGSGSGIRNATPEQLAKARGGASRAVDEGESAAPAPAATAPAAQAQSGAAPANQTQPDAAAPSAAASTRSARPKVARNVLSEEAEIAAEATAKAAAGKSTAAQPPAAAQNNVAEGDDFDAPNTSNQESPAANPSPSSKSVAQSRALDEESGEAGAGQASAPPAVRGGKGVARGVPNGDGAGVTRGKGAPASAVMEADVPVATGPMNLMQRAGKAFEEYKEPDAIHHLYAYWLTSAGAMEEYPLQWVAGISEPRVFFRWGVGVVYSAPTDFEGQPPLIGDPVAATTPSRATPRNPRTGRAGMQRNDSTPNVASASAYAGVDRSTPTGNLIFYTGDFGERLIKRLDSRRLHKDSYYGKMLAVAKYERPEAVGGQVTTTVLSNNRRGNPEHAVILDEEEVDTTRTITTVTPPRAANSTAIAASTGTLVPGVIFLGVESESGGEKTLLEEGKAAGVDAVLLFYVSVKSKGRSDGAFSTTSLGVHNLKTGETQKTATLSSETVAKVREREKDSDNDPVELALDKIFNEYSDDKFRVSAMPELKPEIAKKRVESLVAGSHVNPLPIVAEILSYHKSGLLDQTSTVAALGPILGGDEAAQKLLAGTPEEKLAIIEKWVPSGSATSPQSGAEFR